MLLVIEFGIPVPLEQKQEANPPQYTVIRLTGPEANAEVRVPQQTHEIT